MGHWIIAGSSETTPGVPRGWFNNGFVTFCNTPCENDSTKIRKDYIKAIICGHIHSDCVQYIGNIGIPCIATDTTGFGRLVRVFGGERDVEISTPSELCFDVVNINYEDGSILCERVGRGKSRLIHRGIHEINTNESL